VAEAIDPRDRRIAELERENAELRDQVRALLARVAVLEAKVEQLTAQLEQNSTNSSKPPSSDPPGVARQAKLPSGRKPGGQPGHRRHLRELLPVEQVDHVKEVLPSACRRCKRHLHGQDPDPRRHQVTEVPVIEPTVTEYRLHALECPNCGEVTRAELPAGVPRGAFGPVLASMVALCTIRFRQSKRLAQELFATLLNVEVSLGAISKIEEQTSAALAVPVEEARVYVREQAVANADETGWYEGKSEGKKQRAWLWVLTTPVVTVFKIAKSRGQDVAREMLGGGFQGILGVDRWGAYNFLKALRRQLCWSHLLRDFQGFVDRGGKGGVIGESLLRQADLMFTWWHRIRDGTLLRRTFQRRMEPVTEEIPRLLRAAVVRAEPKTRGMAKAILKLKWALFTFVRESGVEPTNNVAERRIRPAVIARKLSFGTESPEGSRFVERMLTVTTTLKQQDRNVLHYLVAAHEARLLGLPAPSILPN
jgi:transposase